VERLGCAGNGFEGVRDPRGLSATRLVGTFHILTIPIAARRMLIQAVECAGLEVAHLTSTLPAALASVGDETMHQRRVLLIDIGGFTTGVGLFREGLLAGAAIVPWGGLRLATAIAKALGATMDQAVTWSVEGKACRKPEVRALVEQQWEALASAIGELLSNQPRPQTVLLAGRGTLSDGFAEWIEQVTGVRTAFCRSPHTHQLSDVSRQVGLSSALGLLELATRAPESPLVSSPRFFTRLIDRTRVLLTEYF